MGVFDMGEGESNFEGGMSEFRGNNLAQQERELAQLKQQQERQNQNASAQVRTRSTAQHAEEIKKKVQQIKKFRRRASWAVRLLPMCAAGCIPALVIFGAVAILAIAWGILNETTLGHWLGNLLSFFSNEFAEITDEMKK